MKLYLLSLLLIILVIFNPALSLGQNQQQVNAPEGKYQVIKTKNSEQFVLPYSTSNDDRKHPLIYTYDKPKGTNWILTIQNNLSYAIRPDAKTIVKLQDPTPNEEKFIEIAMFSDTSNRFWVAVNTNESGYIRLYDESGNNGWSRDQPVIIAHAINQGLTITNGKRIIIDKLSVEGFILDSIAVYGKDSSDSPLNTYAGNLSFNVIYGNPADSPLYYLPLGMLVGVGSLVLGLLLFKKRKAPYQENEQEQKEKKS
jgi:hypothetical protein